jgi:hypothetical protein
MTEALLTASLGMRFLSSSIRLLQSFDLLKTQAISCATAPVDTAQRSVVQEPDAGTG